MIRKHGFEATLTYAGGSGEAAGTGKLISFAYAAKDHFSADTKDLAANGTFRQCAWAVQPAHSEQAAGEELPLDWLGWTGAADEDPALQTLRSQLTQQIRGERNEK